MELQDMEHVLRILALAEKSERIGIVLGSSAGDIELLAAHALKEKLGEKADILNAPDRLQDRWSHLFKKERSKKETALSLDITLNPVEELRYEKEGGRLKIFLSPHQPITKDSFELEERYPTSDMIIGLGFTGEEDFAGLIQNETPLRNADARINLSAIFSKSEEQGSFFDKKWDINAMKLWGRALLRSYIEEDLGVFWAFLPKEDFTKTDQTDDIIPRLVEAVKTVLGTEHAIVLLWQAVKDETNSVHSFIASTDQRLLHFLAEKTGTAAFHDHLLLRPFSNFSEAELEIRKMIQQVRL